MKKGYLLLKLAAGLLMLAMLSPQLCHAAFTQILYLARYNKAPVFGTDTLGGVTYTTISYEDLMNSGAPGMPSLPVDYLKFSVPYNATNFTVTATPTSNQPHYIDHLLYPCQAPRMINDTTPAVITLPDSAAYYSGTTYPTQTAWVVDEGFLDGENHIVTVAVMPFHYVHTATSDLVAQKRMVSVKLKFDLSDTLAMYPIVRNDSLLREEGYRLTRSMVVNPNQVKTFAPSQITILQDSMGIAHGGIGGDGLNGFDPTLPDFPHPDPTIVDPINPNTQIANIPYLIVTTNELYHSMRRIAALKKQKGYNVDVVTMDQVLSYPLTNMGDCVKGKDGSYHVAYSDDAGKLRHFLKYYYLNCGTKYVLLAGNGVPHRTISLNSGIDEKLRTVQSDLYFCDLNADWSCDTIESSPELFVGRIIAKGSDQIINYTDKLFRYELDPGRGNPSYLKHAFYSQSYDMRLWNEVDYVTRVLDSIYPNPTIMSESLNINDKSKYPSGADIISEINGTHYGFLSLHHHGYPSALLTYGLRSFDFYNFYNNPHKDNYLFLRALEHYRFVDTNYLDDDTLSLNGLDNMTNKWHPSICYTIACKSMPFGVWPQYEDLPMNFGESFTTGKDYGGPIFIGNTNNGVLFSSALLERQIAREVVNGRYVLGEANGYGKLCFKDANPKTQRYVPTVQNFLGDPSLEIWTDEPNKYERIEIERGENCISISGDIIEGTTVAYCDNNKKIGKTVISSPTNIIASPNSTIMLYKHNYIPYIAPLMLQNISIGKSQFVIASDMLAGNHIDTDRNPGDVIVKCGVEYEVEASGTVTLKDGFEVEKGAFFAVYPSSF